MEYIFIIILTSALFMDVSKRKIYNYLTIPTIIYGLFFNFLINSWDGLLFSIFGLLVGILLLLIPFFLGAMGAGDVKLLGAIGAVMGAKFTIYAFLISAVIGGLISLFIILKNGRLGFFFKSILFTVFCREKTNITSSEPKERFTIPYGVPIVIGTFSVMIWGGF